MVWIGMYILKKFLILLNEQQSSNIMIVGEKGVGKST